MAERRRVRVYRPNPGSFDPARKSLALNGLRNVTLTNAALSNREGTLVFRTRDAEGGSPGGLSRVTGDSARTPTRCRRSCPATWCRCRAG